MKATLVLEDGRTFRGRAFGATGEAGGEVCFNTSMSGYQEVLTDPSYRGQIVCMTYPLIGNYGINAADAESRSLHPRAFIVKEVSPIASNRLSECELAEYLAQHGVVGLQDIDTRALTRHLRDKGAMRGIVATGEIDEAALIAKAGGLPRLAEQDLIGQVTTPEPYAWTESISEDWVAADILPAETDVAEASRLHVVAYDFGIKLGILRGLVRTGCRVTVVPARTPASEVLALKPDGVFLSNGPGDPAVLGDVVEQIKRLVDEKPIFGICLGNQILAQVFGAKTYKLKFGHRGANHPVKDLTTGKIEVTTQNHGYCVDADSLSGDVAVTHVNLNDDTVEGIAHRELPVFSVQYHPEASPGPHDAYYLFKRFCDRILAAQA
jgi:carbamoyl-phosphate synthase small subunit